MMMKKKFVAVALSAVCLLSAVGCGQQSASTASSASSVSSSVASSASASQVMDAEDYLSGISGTYVELFPEMAKSSRICCVLIQDPRLLSISSSNSPI